ncbi:tRNA dimethylallyltransferase [Dysgonomonas sp. PFB1-18]|uniref:tRNA (adenosine(37)-N6)-dimethylallyltransferase MiaA n=1 Tax=unclassified Dysgonomonas TaxID=2630389 RepID=UPI0024743DB2|nr:MULTISPECIES: tRNA (adenosine(37)-N6)-dimethylallyltransferase MiaA [unclassified Dysgonomonas]MDH6307759.1 tRNA dimethylallyltransferase [Dysgonomonas sp. PF1-14]MDH6337677.1 tRNA dimethylallyltransferase [Dysgonomonas sp. PF1-16]MDH6378901.1 tRNA dimethylallyltransferase [Dysgonomonas sp. PFB1-18]MDH6396536.1 tRNA dimethylallyltransferase [Dysgonomonas sp. PF1-23]
MKQLIVLLGPTGVGKTALSIDLAEYYKSPIISADSRQFFKGLEIGTAAPTPVQRSRVPHYLVGMLNVTDYYSASEFEQDALNLIIQEHKTHDTVIASGGSMLYIDALCNGIDDVPTIDENLRKDVYKLYEEEGLEPIRAQLKALDPEFYNEVDLKNYKRVIHALEVCLMTGKPYSSFRTKTKKPRPFKIIKIGLMREREELYARINQRVDEMIEAGLLQEAEQFYPQRHLNSLNTVGYKELFKYIDGEWTLDFAIDKIKQNSRIYSRKQMTWFKRDEEIHWINLSETNDRDALNQIIEIKSNLY